MKAYINLLPEKNKEGIREEKQFRDIVNGEISFLFPILLLVGMFFALNVILSIQEEGLNNMYDNEKSQVGFQDLKKYEDKFKEVNLKTALVSKIQSSHLAWSETLVKLSQIVPDGISIMGIANKDYRIFLVGKAETREKLIEFKDKLVAESECFSGVNMPLSNLVSRENIDFQIDFEVKKNCLKIQ